MLFWYNEQICRMHQPQQKEHKKRDIKLTEKDPHNFILKSIFEDSASGSDNSDVNFD